MNENIITEGIRLSEEIFKKHDEALHLRDNFTELSEEELEAAEDKLWADIQRMIAKAKPAVTAAVISALKNAPWITPEEIDNYIPHVNTPKTTEKFKTIAENGLTGLKGLWLLTDYISCEYDHCGPELIVDDEFTAKEDTMKHIDLNCSISDLFLHFEWVENRLDSDVLCEGKRGFNLGIVREILEGRVRTVYIATGAN